MGLDGARDWKTGLEDGLELRGTFMGQSMAAANAPAMLARRRWATALLFTAGAALALASPAGAAKQRPSDPVAAPARGLPDNQLAPLSLSMVKAGEALLAKGQTQAATDSFEAALAADPRNRKAYLGMARAAEAEGLPGKAVRFYREALELEPNDLTTLELQGLSLVERGAKARAQANAERIRTLCGGPCPQADRLEAAITRGPKRPAALQTATAERSQAATPADAASGEPNR